MVNAFTHANRQSDNAQAKMRFLKGTVVDVPDAEEIPHMVGVKPRGKDVKIPALVNVDIYGDANLPAEDTPVTLGHLEGGMYFVVGARYTTDEDTPNPPTNNANERYIGHQLTDASIHFDEDGTITVENGSGASITLDGENVILGDGGNGVITDIETSTSDGYVTDITIQRSDTIEI